MREYIVPFLVIFIMGILAGKILVDKITLDKLQKIDMFVYDTKTGDLKWNPDKTVYTVEELQKALGNNHELPNPGPKNAKD